jgi:hypothetical protein
MRVLRTLSATMTADVCGAASAALQVNSFEGSLMIEWA